MQVNIKIIYYLFIKLKDFFEMHFSYQGLRLFLSLCCCRKHCKLVMCFKNLEEFICTDTMISIMLLLQQLILISYPASAPFHPFSKNLSLFRNTALLSGQG